MDEDTNGHVDNFACFLSPGKVALAWSADGSDEQHGISAEALRVLEGETDARGRRLEVVKVPCPAPMYLTEEEAASLRKGGGFVERKAGERLAASYINFYISNATVVVPAFGDPNDEVAASLLREAFPTRKVVSVYTRNMLIGGGNIHCQTQQVPALPR